MTKTILLCLAYLVTMTLTAQTFTPRPLVELINTKESAWKAFLQDGISRATNHIEVLARDSVKADSALYKSQVTTRSPMGSIVYETGGILINHGWIRILGSGSNKMERNLMDWNKGKTYTNLGDPLPFLLVADDVLGGFFAINAGGISPEGIQKIFYLAPDNLKWMNTDLTYSQFLNFCFCGDIKTYYETFYWKGWEKDITSINGDQGVSCYPFLCTVEGNDINKVSKKIVPMEELWYLHNDLRKQFVTGEK